MARRNRMFAERRNAVENREPKVLWFNLRGDKETLADVRATIAEIKKLLPEAGRMYLDVPENHKSICVVQAAVHLYYDSLKGAMEEITREPKKSLNRWGSK